MGDTRKMAQQLRAVTVLAEDLSSNPSTHMASHNHSEFQFQGTPLSHAPSRQVPHTHTCGQNSHTHNMYNFLKNIKNQETNSKNSGGKIIK